MASMGSTQGSSHHTHCDTDNTITQHCDASASLRNNYENFVWLAKKS